MSADCRDFDELVSRLDGYAWKLARRFYAPGLDADDVHQFALIAMWRAWQTYDPTRGTLEAFAVLAMRSSVITEVERARKAKRFSAVQPLSLSMPVDEDGTPLSEMLEQHGSDPFDRLLERERVARLVAVVAEMTPLQRRAVAHRLNERTYHYDKSIDNGLQKARRKIRVAFKEAA